MATRAHRNVAKVIKLYRHAHRTSGQAMRIPGLLLLVSMTACATEASPCEEAAASLTGCTPDQRAAVIAACDASGGAAETAAGTDGAEVCTAVPDDGKTDQGTLALTGLCVASMYGVKWAVTYLSPDAEPLSDDLKAKLRPLHGSLVDEARISLGAALPPKIKVGSHTLSVPPAAMTFGNTIFILDEVARDPRRLLVKTAHELRHVQQAKHDGGFYGFAVEYCRDMIAADFKYDAIALEEDAYVIEHATEHNLATCGKVTCP